MTIVACFCSRVRETCSKLYVAVCTCTSMEFAVLSQDIEVQPEPYEQVILSAEQAISSLYSELRKVYSS